MRRLAILIVLIGTFLSCAAHAQTLTGLALDGSSAQTRLRLDFDTGLARAPKAVTIDSGRIIIDFAKLETTLPGTLLANGQRRLAGQGLISQVRYAARGDEGLRLVLDLAAPAQISDSRAEGRQVTYVVAAAPGAVVGGLPIPRLKPVRAPVKKPVIVIDAGHGGYDPGAIGRKYQTKEKTVTFSAADILRDKLLKTGRYQVVLTRGRDIYIAHEERLRIARLGGADLFISIHADSAGNASARGASVYTLSDRAKTRSRNLVASQNWIMDVDLAQQSDPVGDILVDLAQRKTDSQSAEFADILLSELAKTSKMIGNSHRRAGYFVLLAPDVPAVLLELGFLSNAEDEKLLRTKAHRTKLMSSVVKAIDTYFSDR